VSDVAIVANSCPPFLTAIRSAFARFPGGPINPAQAYPTNGAENGCSVVSASPRAPSTATRVFYKAYLSLTSAQWAYMISSAGFTNTAFVREAIIVCNSVMHFGPAQGFSRVDISTAQLPALGISGQCSANPTP